MQAKLLMTQETVVGLLKILCKENEMLVTNTFSSFHNDFFPFLDNTSILASHKIFGHCFHLQKFNPVPNEFRFSRASGKKAFENIVDQSKILTFGRVYILLPGKGLTHYQTTKF